MKIRKNMMVINERLTTNREEGYRLSNGTLLEKWCNHSHGQRGGKHTIISKCRQKSNSVLSMEEFLRHTLICQKKNYKSIKTFYMMN